MDLADVEQTDARARISPNVVGKRLAANNQTVNSGDNDAEGEDSPLQSKRSSMFLFFLILFKFFFFCFEVVEPLVREKR